jgi:preprotein translocase subunit SecG
MVKRKKSNKLLLYFSLILVCFLIVILIIIGNFDGSNVGRAISVGVEASYYNFLSTFLITLMVFFMVCVYVFSINNINPHIDQEMANFNVDIPTKRKNLESFLKHSKNRGRSYLDVKELLMESGWKEDIIRKEANKLNR